LQLRNDRPVIAYWGGRRELTLAACTAGCATATPTWSISAVDPSTEGWYPSLQLDGSRAFITYYAWEGDLKMAVVELDAPAAANYTAFWWNPAESGWGMHLTHGGNTLFALLYTYAMDGAPMWLAKAAQAPVGLAHFGTTLQDWTGKTTMKVRFKVTAGGNPDPAFPAGAQAYVQTTTNYAGIFGYNNVAAGTDWQIATVALNPATPPTGWNLAQVQQVGLKITTGNGTGDDAAVASGPPTAATIYVDSVWAE